MNKNPIQPPPQSTLNFPIRPKHVRIIQLYLEGNTYKQISKELDTNNETISQIVKKYGITEMLMAVLEQYRYEIKGLVPLAVGAVRNSLENGEGLERLKAADMVFKLTQLYDAPQKIEETATTQMQKVLDLLKKNSE